MFIRLPITILSLVFSVLIVGCQTTGNSFQPPEISLSTIQKSGNYCEITDPAFAIDLGFIKFSPWWSGACKNGSPFGSGTLLTFAKNALAERYEGPMQTGLLGQERHGKGVITYFLQHKVVLPNSRMNRWSYEGDFKHNKRTGTGVYTDETGLKVEGNFINGKPHGVCIVTAPDGNSGEVEFDNGKPVR